MTRAIFLDRDGTIIKDNGYIGKVDDVKFYHYTFDCLRQLQKKFLLFIVTNQSGISKGLINQDSVDKIHSYISQKMNDNGIEIKEIYCCPHTNEDKCLCKKPRPLFIDKAKSEYSIDILNSYVIGDHPSDIELALNVQANGIYLLTGHGRRHYYELNRDTGHKIKIRHNLAFATKTILNTINKNNGTQQGVCAMAVDE